MSRRLSHLFLPCIFITILSPPVYADLDPCQLDKFTPDVAVINQYFGISVDIDGAYAVIGQNDIDRVGVGSAYILHNTGSQWVVEDVLTSNDLVPGDRFGSSVAISGDTVIVGAFGGGDAGYNSGAAYVFRRSGTTWSEEARLVASDGQERDLFGRTVALDGDCAVIGAYADDDAGNAAGSAYIFRRSGTVWSEEIKLIGSDTNEEDCFGGSVSISGNLVMIGAALSDEGGLNKGSAYIFRYDAPNWIEEAKFPLDTGDDHWGETFPVAIDGDCAVIGVYWDEDEGTYTGSARIHRRLSPGVWNDEGKLLASDAAAGNSFGRSVAVQGDLILVGSGGNDSGGLGAGAAYLFEHTAGTWTEQTMFIPSDSSDFAYFGYSAALDGMYAFVGAPLNVIGGYQHTGSAYVFDIDGTSCGTLSVLLSCSPAQGTVPFASNMTVSLINTENSYRRLAAHLDMSLAGGTFFSNWRAGYTNLASGEDYTSVWNQNFPALGTLVGINSFNLVAEDVTPAPYNQPPYAPAGDTDSALCSITVVAP